QTSVHAPSLLRQLSLRRMHRSLSGQDKLASSPAAQPAERLKAKTLLHRKTGFQILRFCHKSATGLCVCQEGRAFFADIPSIAERHTIGSRLRLDQDPRVAPYCTSDLQRILEDPPSLIP